MSAPPDVLCLTLYPASSEVVQDVGMMFEGSCEAIVASELRGLSPKALLKRFTQRRVRNVVIPVQEADSTLILPILYLIAVAHLFPIVYTLDHKKKLSKVSKTKIFKGLCGLIYASILGQIARIKIRVHAKHLRQDAPISVEDMHHTHRVMYIKNNM